MSWKRDGYVVLKNALSKDLITVLAREIKMKRDVLYFKHDVDRRYKNAFGDVPVKNCFSIYSLLGIESLLDTVLKKIVEKNTGVKVIPTYSYGRIYYRGAELVPHRDRQSCEISVTCCLTTDGTRWPIGFITRQNKKVLVNMNPGDIIIYLGCELTHWRDKYKGHEQIQAFAHYVPNIPKNRKLKYDKRPMLGLPGPYRREN